MKLHRPHIPWSVREQVIDRQMAEAKFTPTWAIKYAGSAEKRVRMKLEEFFAGKAVELHHRPALMNRKRMYAGIVLVDRTEPRRLPLDPSDWKDLSVTYLPDANDPNHLVYLLAGAGEEHDVETRVRGQHGQHSDLALARKRKRKERKARRPKRAWPKRKFPKARDQWRVT